MATDAAIPLERSLAMIGALAAWAKLALAGPAGDHLRAAAVRHGAAVVGDHIRDLDLLAQVYRTALAGVTA